jgi:flagellar motor component MotA
MKRVTAVIAAGLLALSLVVVAGCGSGSGAIAYNDKIIKLQNNVVKEMIALSQTFTKKDHAEMMGKLKELQDEIDDSIEGLTAMDGYEGDTSLRDAVKELMEFYKDITANEYKEMIDIIGRTSPPITQTDISKLQQMQQDITARENLLDAKLGRIQTEFATKHGIQIKANELQKKIDDM